MSAVEVNSTCPIEDCWLSSAVVVDRTVVLSVSTAVVCSIESTAVVYFDSAVV